MWDMIRFCRANVLALIAFAACAFATPFARASTDAHETARDVRIVVDSDGSALVDETTHIRLFYGGWKGLDIPNVEIDAIPESDATITSIDGGTFAAHLSEHEKGLAIDHHLRDRAVLLEGGQRGGLGGSLGGGGGRLRAGARER